MEGGQTILWVLNKISRNSSTKHNCTKERIKYLKPLCLCTLIHLTRKSFDVGLGLDGYNSDELTVESLGKVDPAPGPAPCAQVGSISGMPNSFSGSTSFGQIEIGGVDTDLMINVLLSHLVALKAKIEVQLDH